MYTVLMQLVNTTKLVRTGYPSEKGLKTQDWCVFHCKGPRQEAKFFYFRLKDAHKIFLQMNKVNASDGSQFMSLYAEKNKLRLQRLRVLDGPLVLSIAAVTGPDNVIKLREINTVGRFRKFGTVLAGVGGILFALWPAYKPELMNLIAIIGIFVAIVGAVLLFWPER